MQPMIEIVSPESSAQTARLTEQNVRGVTIHVLYGLLRGHKQTPKRIESTAHSPLEQWLFDPQYD